MNYASGRLGELLAENPQAADGILRWRRAKRRGSTPGKRRIDQPFRADQWARRAISDAKKRSRRKGLAFDLTALVLVKMLHEQHGLCALSGVPFSDANPSGAHKRPFMPSVDRIDSARGYVPNNVRLVCVAVNTLLQDWGDSIFTAIIGPFRNYAARAVQSYSAQWHLSYKFPAWNTARESGANACFMLPF